MPIELGRRLISAGIAAPDDVEAALLLSVVRGVSFVRALVDRGAVDERSLEEELGRRGGLALRHVLGLPELVARLPPNLCRRLGAVPTRFDTFTGTVDVAAADPLDPHVGAEFGFHLASPIRVIRAPISAIEEALRRLDLDEPTTLGEGRPRRSTPAFPHGAPSSSPPPPLDDVPIPLIRRLGVPLVDESDPDLGNPNATAAMPLFRQRVARPREPVQAFPAVPPLTPSGAEPSPDSDGAGSSLLEPEVTDGGTLVSEVEARRRPQVIREPKTPAPSVSFPSEPPLGPSSNADSTVDTLPRPRLPALPPPEPWEPSLRPDPVPAARGATTVGPAVPRPAIDVTVPPRRSHGATDVRAIVGSPSELPRLPSPPALEGHDPRPSTPARRVTPAGGVRALTPPAGVRAVTPSGSARAPTPPPTRTLLSAGPPPLPGSDLGVIVRGLAEARSRDEVVDLVMRGLLGIAERAAVFAVKKSGFQGWTCNEAFGDPQALRAVHVPAGEPSMLATATAASLYLGPIPQTPAHAALLAVMGTAGPDVAAVAVRAHGRAAMLLIADDLGDTLHGTRRMDELARAAGEALSRLLANRASQG